MSAAERAFAAAVAAPDLAAAARAVLELEAEIVSWAADTEEDAGGVDQARELMRLLIARLGEQAATAGVHTVMGPLLALRGELRAQGRYEVADALREALLEGGVLVEDTPDGPRWTVVPPPRPPVSHRGIEPRGARARTCLRGLRRGRRRGRRRRAVASGAACRCGRRRG
ncbi:hypothetical protein ACFSTC_33190 [Nonomuraea ferruginea]